MQLSCGYFLFALLVIGAAWADDKKNDTIALADTMDESDDATTHKEEDTTTTTEAPPMTTTGKVDPEGDFKLKEMIDGNEFDCLHLKAEITFTLVPVDKKEKTETFSLNSHAKVDHDHSSCAAYYNKTQKKVVFDGKPQTLALTQDGREVILSFTDDTAVTKKSGRYALNQVCLNGACGNVTGLVANTDSSYFCTPRQNFTDFVNSTEYDISVSFAHVQMQAFLQNSTTFGNQYQCEAMRSNDLVPIIVGSCLAALVVIVLIAYLIGRSRAKSSGTGYESV